jgi:hypothetical protein
MQVPKRGLTGAASTLLRGLGRGAQLPRPRCGQVRRRTGERRHWTGRLRPAHERDGDICPSAVVRRRETAGRTPDPVARRRETLTPGPSDVAREPSAAAATRERSVWWPSHADATPSDAGPVAVNRLLALVGVVRHAGSAGSCHGGVAT